MVKSFKKYASFFAFLVLSLAIVSSAFAEASDSERSLTGFFKRLFNYPVKAAKETVQMTGNTLQNTGEKVVSKTGEKTAEVLKGDVAKTGELVTEPVKGAAETVGQTASETVQIPVKAAEEDKPAETPKN